MQLRFCSATVVSVVEYGSVTDFGIVGADGGVSAALALVWVEVMDCPRLWKQACHILVMTMVLLHSCWNEITD